MIVLQFHLPGVKGLPTFLVALTALLVCSCATWEKQRELKGRERCFKAALTRLPMPTTREKLASLLPPDRHVAIRHPFFSGGAYLCVFSGGYVESYPLDKDFGILMSVEYKKRPSVKPLDTKMRVVRSGAVAIVPDSIDDALEVLPKPSQDDVIRDVTVERWSRDLAMGL